MDDVGSVEEVDGGDELLELLPRVVFRHAAVAEEMIENLPAGGVFRHHVKQLLRLHHLVIDVSLIVIDVH